MKTGDKAALALEPLKARFAGRPVLIFAPGPSLPKLWNGHVSDLPKIAVGNAYTLVPDADVLYHTDAAWWEEYKPNFTGIRISYEPVKDAIRVEGTGAEGYDPRLGYVRNGNNSGYVATHIAAQLGCNPIILVGFDMKPTKPLDRGGKNHFFGEHRGSLTQHMPYKIWIMNFKALKKTLKKYYNVDLLHATPGSALEDIPYIELEKVLGGRL